jgi:Domain of unknown function (DUF1906)
MKLRSGTRTHIRGRWLRAWAVPAALLLAMLGVGATGGAAHAAMPGPVVTKADGFDQECALNSGQIAQIFSSYQDIYFFGFYLDAPDAAAWNSGDCPDQSSNADKSTIQADANTGIGLGLFYTGLQDPCSNISGEFSTNTSTAHSQGEDAAADAWDEAEDLGFPANVYIYNDLEAYDTSDSTCVSAATSYISGWDSEMEGLGGHPGVYGSVCGSDLSELAGSSPDPQAIWGAWYTTAASTSTASLDCIPNNYWDNNQRLVQWTNTGALSTEGNTTLNDSPVDYDCADGPTMDIHFGSGVTLGDGGCKGQEAFHA